jgi:hypothetical protein
MTTAIVDPVAPIAFSRPENRHLHALLLGLALLKNPCDEKSRWKWSSVACVAEKAFRKIRISPYTASALN